MNNLDSKLEQAIAVELGAVYQGANEGRDETTTSAHNLKALFTSELQEAVEAFAAELKGKAVYYDDDVFGDMSVYVDDIDKALIERTKHE